LQYLGNVNHASNALMLKAIGITHVVSMGESALHPPPKGASGLSLLTSPFRSSSPALPSNSLWEEERNGTIEVLDMQNVADDGIDSIRPCIDEALEFIRTARQQGGKILVHCKVGVSRSASIVIAYLMREMGLDLASSYLLTRSRRLNILVQPNLPFIAALHAFEAELLEEKERVAALSRPRAAQGHSPSSSIGSVSEYGDCVDEKEELDSLQVLGQPGLKRSNRLAFSFLCGEIARLNERFLC
jgi:dual specificity MAP kinase phosphatase